LLANLPFHGPGLHRGNGGGGHRQQRQQEGDAMRKTGTKLLHGSLRRKRCRKRTPWRHSTGVNSPAAWSAWRFQRLSLAVNAPFSLVTPICHPERSEGSACAAIKVERSRSLAALG